MEKTFLVALWLGSFFLTFYIACDRPAAIPTKVYVTDDKKEIEKECIDGEIFIKFAGGFMPLFDKDGFPIVCDDIKAVIESGRDD